MRIEGGYRSMNVSRSGAAKASAGASFAAESSGGATRASMAAPLAAAGSIDMLMALQGVGDALTAKRKAVKRGATLLDVLDQVKAELLSGRIDAGRLDALVQAMQVPREKVEPGLDAVLDDIELRARVELAKCGRFPDIAVAA